MTTDYTNMSYELLCQLIIEAEAGLTGDLDGLRAEIARRHNADPSVQAVCAQLDAQVVMQHAGKPVTRAELNDLFQKVQNRSNWKYPIEAVVELDDDEVAKLSYAIGFFAGSPSEFISCNSPVARGPVVTPGKQWYMVTAPGYYVCVGA